MLLCHDIVTGSSIEFAKVRLFRLFRVMNAVMLRTLVNGSYAGLRRRGGHDGHRGGLLGFGRGVRGRSVSAVAVTHSRDARSSS